MVTFLTYTIWVVLIISIGDYFFVRHETEQTERYELRTIVLCAVALYFMSKY